MKTIIKTVLTLQLIVITTGAAAVKQYENKSSQRNYSYATLSADIKGNGPLAYNPETRLGLKIDGTATATKILAPWDISHKFWSTVGLISQYVNTHFKALEPHYDQIVDLNNTLEEAINRVKNILSQSNLDVAAKKEALKKEIKSFEEIRANLATAREAVATQCRTKSIKASINALLFSPQLACQLLTELSDELMRSVSRLSTPLEIIAK